MVLTPPEGRCPPNSPEPQKRGLTSDRCGKPRNWPTSHGRHMPFSTLRCHPDGDVPAPHSEQSLGRGRPACLAPRSKPSPELLASNTNIHVSGRPAIWAEASSPRRQPGRLGPWRLEPPEDVLPTAGSRRWPLCVAGANVAASQANHPRETERRAEATSPVTSRS